MALKVLSLFGLAVFLGLAWSLSLDRRRFPWRTVLWGLGIQFTLAVLILKTAAGEWVFLQLQEAFLALMGFAAEGAGMVFGPLADPAALERGFGPENTFIFAVAVTSTIILVSALSSLLYHWGVLQWLVRGAAWCMQKVMRTSGSESLAAAANVFMGQTEAPLVVKPYLAGMTRSELLALMTGGMATIAGGVLAVYVLFGISAGHLLTASVMSAPAALLVAKIMLPESEPSQTAAGADPGVETGTVNSLDALCRGAGDGMKMSINILAMLIAFVALVALANALLAAPQRQFGVADPVTLQVLLGWANAPFAILIGVPPHDSVAVGQMLGERIVLNEFIAYLSLSGMEGELDERSFILATYALCGFANFASIAIQIGGIGTLAPERRADLARLGPRAMVGGILAAYLTATIVGILI